MLVGVRVYVYVYACVLAPRGWSREYAVMLAKCVLMHDIITLSPAPKWFIE